MDTLRNKTDLKSKHEGKNIPEVQEAQNSNTKTAPTAI